MPEEVDTIMFAPCGMNCVICDRYVKGNCSGCLIDSTNKTKSALKCKLKDCLSKKRVKYCGRCSEFPCKLIKKHDKNNKKRYNYSTMDSAKRIKNTGIKRIIKDDITKYTCPECSGIITIQERKCSECKKVLDDT